MNYTNIELGGKTRRLKFTIENTEFIEDVLLKGVILSTLFSNPNLLTIGRTKKILFGLIQSDEKNITEQRVGMLLQEFLDNGGDINDLKKNIIEAAHKSGVFVKYEPSNEGEEVTEGK